MQIVIFIYNNYTARNKLSKSLRMNNSVEAVFSDEVFSVLFDYFKFFYFKEVEIERPQKPPIELLVKNKNMPKRYFENMLGTALRVADK